MPNTRGSMPTLPPPPEVPASQTATAEVEVRYEDITQDGRVRLEALPTALGAACWRRLLHEHPLSLAARRQGIVPILSRLLVEGGGGPVSVRRPLLARGRYELAHTERGGEVDRLIMNLYAEVEGVVGRTHGPPPDDAGEPVAVGRVFAEHVFTRPFAPAAERRVLELPAGEGLPGVPPAVHRWQPAEAAATLPPGATPLDREPRPDAQPVVFGLAHTDSNQHVNSLVYPRVLEEAALRRLAEDGRETQVLARFVELAYRRPCFAGDRLRLDLQAFEHEGRVGTTGVFRGPEGRAHTYARLVF